MTAPSHGPSSSIPTCRTEKRILDFLLFSLSLSLTFKSESTCVFRARPLRQATDTTTVMLLIPVRLGLKTSHCMLLKIWAFPKTKYTQASSHLLLDIRIKGVLHIIKLVLCLYSQSARTEHPVNTLSTVCLHSSTYYILQCITITQRRMRRGSLSSLVPLKVSYSCHVRGFFLPTLCLVCSLTI